jgi:hypothetical protein
MATALENVFYQDQTVEIKPRCLIEYNMNELIDGVSVFNVEVSSDYTSDAAYRSQIKYKKDGVYVDYPSDGPIPFKKLFPLESVVQPFRPSSSGIKYFIPGIGTKDPDGQLIDGDDIQDFKKIIYPSNTPRIYYPGISTPYKYWVGAKNKHIALKVVYKHDNTTWEAAKIANNKKGSIPVGNKAALANKIVVKFEKYHYKPVSAFAIITKLDGTVLPNVALTIPTASDWNGEVNLYYNGTTWSTTNSISYTSAEQIKSIQINALNPQPVIASTDLAVIEISARWIKNVSDDLISLSINESSSGQDGTMLPVGAVNSNTLQMSLANYTRPLLNVDVYERNITSFNASQIYLVKNAKIIPSFNIYHPNGTLTDSNGKYDNSKQGEFYIDTYSVSEYGDYDISALDGSKFLMETFCPDIICENYPATAILRRLFDSVGFTNYNFNIKLQGDTDDSVINVRYWWTEDTETIWEALQDLCKDSQINAFFDKNGTLQIYTRNAIYDNSREIDWEFFYDQSGGILPNISSFSKIEIPSANSVKVLWQTPIASTYVGDSSKLWDSPPYILAAGGLGKDIEEDSEDFVISLDTIDRYSKASTITSFEGFVLIDSEVIEYDAIGYQYTDKEDNFIENEWISSEADLSQYRSFSKAGAADNDNYQETAYFRPNGRYRIKKDQYGTLVGRGALGTTKADHLAADRSYDKWQVLEVTF